MAKEPSIEISPKYGVNPMRAICAFCGNETGEIAMLGRIRERKNGRVVSDSDIEAPSTGIINYAPCPNCKAKMDTGITLIGITNSRVAPLQPSIGKDDNNEEMFPTGDWVVVSEEFVTTNFSKETADGMIASRKCAVPQEVVDDIIEAFKKTSDEDDENEDDKPSTTGDDDINA